MKNTKFENFLSLPIEKKFVEKIKYECTSPLADIILTKNYYRSNIELKEFTANYLQEDYKEYLFSARPALYAKVVRDIFVAAEKDNDKFILKIKGIRKFLSLAETDSNSDSALNKKNQTKSSSNSSTLRAWSKIINPKGNENED
ncbi:hypothetical protein [Enterococcus xiangfangensis]|uniref:Uncharacterized protein n=1 Tax=Enterococcus xiangfangensis TaxID=1296537 RepID=A0ABU3FED2_9ENTE|nr:hypothetical protein [Enterococcus xiangfangensis]MDT2760387.1 hypothetical protein [Enterococcus xiangfangensis]